MIMGAVLSGSSIRYTISVISAELKPRSERNMGPVRGAVAGRQRSNDKAGISDGSQAGCQSAALPEGAQRAARPPGRPRWIAWGRRRGRGPPQQRRQAPLRTILRSSLPGRTGRSQAVLTADHGCRAAGQPTSPPPAAAPGAAARRPAPPPRWAAPAGQGTPASHECAGARRGGPRHSESVSSIWAWGAKFAPGMGQAASQPQLPHQLACRLSCLRVPG